MKKNCVTFSLMLIVVMVLLNSCFFMDNMNNDVTSKGSTAESGTESVDSTSAETTTSKAVGFKDINDYKNDYKSTSIEGVDMLIDVVTKKGYADYVNTRTRRYDITSSDLSDIVNITPKGVLAETDKINIFYPYKGCNLALIDGDVFSFGGPGQYFNTFFLWDAWEEGIKHLFFVKLYGESGQTWQELGILYVDSKKPDTIYREPYQGKSWDIALTDTSVYINNCEITFSKDEWAFQCEAFTYKDDENWVVIK